jgi:hypothetical protein
LAAKRISDLITQESRKTVEIIQELIAVENHDDGMAPKLRIHLQRQREEKRLTGEPNSD